MTSAPPPFVRDSASGAVLEVLVVPRASKTEVKGEVDGRLKVRLAAPPVDGLANEELLDFLAKALSVKKSALELARGESGRRKTVRIEGTTAAFVAATLKPRVDG